MNRGDIGGRVGRAGPEIRGPAVPTVRAKPILLGGGDLEIPCDTLPIDLVRRAQQDVLLSLRDQ